MTSTDLELRRPPTKLRLTNTTADKSSPSIANPDISDEYCGCRTPTAAEHRIPANLTCPPAPRKRRREVAACRRKLQFYEAVAGEEIESFFRSSFELMAAKKRRPCT